MNKSTSLYLDAMRFFAAFVVFAGHANSDKFTGGLSFFTPFMPFGNDAVMVFFVLSGFVIAFVANGKEKSIDKYFISRFARLYSVVLPALLLTILLDSIGSHLSYNQLYTDWGKPVARLFANLFFVNQLWFLNIRPFSNVPFWSIGYEFWYYVIFAIWFYLSGHKKYVLLILVSLLVGPKILLLLPIWFLGVLVYKVTSSTNVSEPYGWALFISSIVFYSLYLANSGHEFVSDQTKLFLGQDIYIKLGWSRKFVNSYIVGLLIAVNFIGVSAISHRFSSFMELFETPIRYLASYTFALYLFHFPLLQFFSALTFDPKTNRTEPAIVVVGTVIIVWLLGSITEKRKGYYKMLFEKMWSLMKRGKL